MRTGPVISCDISNGSMYYQMFIDKEKPAGKPKKVKFNKSDFSKFKKDYDKLAKKTGCKDIGVIYEATGVYHWPLRRYLVDNEITNYEVNPKVSHSYAKTDLNGNKTDKQDCGYISEVYYNSKKLQKYYVSEQIYNDLKQMNRDYESEVQIKVKRENAYKTKVASAWPGLAGVKGLDICSEIIIVAIRMFPTPELMTKHKESVVDNAVIKAMNGAKHAHSEDMICKKVHRIYEFASSCVSSVRPNEQMAKSITKAAERLQDEIELCEDDLEELVEAAKDLPEFTIITSIRGIGANLGARIIAELGDYRRFRNRKAVIAYTGLNPNVNQSGSDDGSGRAIKKNGNKHLRTILFLAIGQILIHNGSCEIANYCKEKNKIYRIRYKILHGNEKMQRLDHIRVSKAAKTAASNKLIRVIYSILLNSSPYDNR